MKRPWTWATVNLHIMRGMADMVCQEASARDSERLRWIAHTILQEIGGTWCPNCEWEGEPS